QAKMKGRHDFRSRIMEHAPKGLLGHASMQSLLSLLSSITAWNKRSAGTSWSRSTATSAGRCVRNTVARRGTRTNRGSSRSNTGHGTFHVHKIATIYAWMMPAGRQMPEGLSGDAAPRVLTADKFQY